MPLLILLGKRKIHCILQKKIKKWDSTVEIWILELLGCRGGARKNQCPVSGEESRGHACCFRKFQNLQLERRG
jgi:hypothetical protein